MNVTGKTLSNVVQNVVCHVKNTAGKKEIVCFRFPTNLEMERKQTDRQTDRVQFDERDACAKSG